MTLQSSGVLCPLAGWSSRVSIFILLAAPAVLSQQQKPLPPVQNGSPPAQMGANSDVNDRIATLAVAASVKQGDYQIGSGDVLGVEVFDVPELSREVHVTGLTTFQVQDKLSELLQSNGLVSTPQVSVTLKEQHSQPITVIGAVKAPMVIQAVRQTTLLQVLSQAGGVSEDAGSTVIVTRPPLVPTGSED